MSLAPPPLRCTGIVKNMWTINTSDELIILDVVETKDASALLPFCDCNTKDPTLVLAVLPSVQFRVIYAGIASPFAFPRTIRQ